MNIDIRTLVIVLCITSLLQVIALFLQYRVNKTYQGIGWWLLGFTSLALGYGFLFLRDLISIKLITIIFANLLVLSGFIFIYIGVMRFFDKKENRGIVISIFALFIISFFYYTYFDDDITLRTVIVYAAAGTISLLTAQGLFLNKTRSITASAYLNTALFLSQGFYFAFRALVTLTVAPVNGLFSATTIQTVSFLFLFVQGILLTFGLIIMVNQRLNAGMTEANEQLQSDITERKRAEEALRWSETQLQAILESTADGILAVDNKGKVIKTNRRLVDFWRIPQSVMDSGDDRDLLDFVMNQLSDPEAFLSKVRLLYDSDMVDSDTVAFKDGRVFERFFFPMIMESVVIGRVWSFRDITDSSRMKEALRESENRYRELSIIDDLTQLYNSRHFYFQLKIELNRSNRYEQPLTILMLDIDNFKAFNDTYGHVEGDQVLSRLGHVIKRSLRETDSAYRYGGEEFTVLLPMTTSAEGAVTAERIRAEVKKENFSPVPGQDVHVTVSIGLSQYKPQEEMKVFVHRVDQLMYQGKKNGKDRVCSEP